MNSTEALVGVNITKFDAFGVPDFPSDERKSNIPQVMSFTRTFD